MARPSEPPVDVLDFLYSPPRAVAAALSVFKQRQNAQHRLTWGVQSLDEYLIPWMDGDIGWMLARPGHAKTSSMVHLARQGTQVCHTMAQKGTGFDRIVVFATWETTVEEWIALLTSKSSEQTMEMIARGEADLRRVEDAAVASINDRIFVIGKSSQRPSYTPITIQTVDHICRLLIEEGKKPLLILLDYLQRIPGLPGIRDKREQVEQNASYAKTMAVNLACPVVGGVQAKRDVDGYAGLQMPTLSDAQWASVIEQDADKLIGQTRPILYMDEGEEILEEATGRVYRVTESLLVQKVLKQRWGRVGKTFFTHFDPTTITLGDLTWDEERF